MAHQLDVDSLDSSAALIKEVLDETDSYRQFHHGIEGLQG